MWHGYIGNRRNVDNCGGVDKHYVNNDNDDMSCGSATLTVAPDAGSTTTCTATRTFTQAELDAAVRSAVSASGLKDAYIRLLITRGKDGKPRAFVNACRHRGAPIAVDGLGHANRFVCPYHGWTFRNDGSLFAVSEAHKFGQIDKDAEVKDMRLAR